MKLAIFIIPLCWAGSVYGKVYKCEVHKLSCPLKETECIETTIEEVGSLDVDTSEGIEKKVKYHDYEIKCIGEDLKYISCSIASDDQIFPTTGVASENSVLMLRTSIGKRKALQVYCE